MEEVKPKKTVARKATTKTAGAVVPRKRAVKKASEIDEVVLPVSEVVVEATTIEPEKPVAKTASVPAGKYVFATGRRKTATATIRLFEGKGESMINKKPSTVYFANQFLRDEALQAFKYTGMMGQYYFVCTVTGGGSRAQAHAIRHGISRALASLGEEVRKVLKKNGLMTRDSREKERKKPGLRRARRAPQWAKR
ncbi:MAG: 30S ribosomal protein S9 [Candidatus Doudnabacteria bacterium]|nr:30S ribosomal protein S9 [Candidatus Doudnabacteria bacterium]